MAFAENPDFAATLGRIAQAFSRRDLPFMVIGGQAVLVHREPRLTQDIDLRVGVAPDRIADILSACADAGYRRCPATWLGSSARPLSCHRSARVGRTG